MLCGMELADLRRDYTKNGLDEATMPAEPLPLLEDWLKTAANGGVPEPNAMALATVDAEGRPFTRTVLLKQMDSLGLVFYTNYESRKAKHIECNPAVSLLFLWLDLERQVSVNGRAERVPTAESLRYFVTRPFGSRLGAWSSPQSRVITSRALLEAKLEEMKRKFRSGEVPLPSHWGGYRVVPESFEFWQGRQNRLHDRFLYTRGGDGAWTRNRLAP